MLSIKWLIIALVEPICPAFQILRSTSKMQLWHDLCYCCLSTLSLSLTLSRNRNVRLTKRRTICLIVTLEQHTLYTIGC